MAELGPLSNQTLGGKYVLGELLGQGGFGAVYQARHTLLNRRQAVKVLLEQHFTSPKFRERFIREAQTLAALDHPNIVHVDDFGFDGSRAYLVMPYIGGGNLQRILRRRGPLPLEDATRYLEQICAALDYAHARSVAHLDLKPLNLLVHEDGRLLLSDFGLAHLMEQGAIEGSTSLQFGSPHYMAPEHIQLQPERRSDLYALGIILYQMLAGRVPFEGSNSAAILYQQVHAQPPLVRAIRPELPEGLDKMLVQALAKRADERYQSAGALLAAFKAATRPQPKPEPKPAQLQPQPNPEPKRRAITVPPMSEIIVAQPQPSPEPKRQAQPRPTPPRQAQPQPAPPNDDEIDNIIHYQAVNPKPVPEPGPKTKLSRPWGYRISCLIGCAVLAAFFLLPWTHGNLTGLDLVLESNWRWLEYIGLWLVPIDGLLCALLGVLPYNEKEGDLFTLAAITTILGGSAFILGTIVFIIFFFINGSSVSNFAVGFWLGCSILLVALFSAFVGTVDDQVIL